MLYLDLETYSPVPIDHGTYAYARAAEVMLLAWALEDDPVQVVDFTVGQTMPERLEEALYTDPVIVVHNSFFDRTVLREAMGINIPTSRIHDTMVQALLHGLPAGLSALGAALGLPEDFAKIAEGRRYVNLFCKPRPKNARIRRATHETHPYGWAAFVEYAKRDIVAMRACKTRMPAWNLTQEEMALWQLDQRINDRGFQVDTDLARAAVRTIAAEQARLAEHAQDLTDSAVSAASERDKVLAFIRNRGVILPDLQKATVERALSSMDLPSEVESLLLNRQQSSSSSTAKYQKLLDATCPDGRLRGTLQFAGASRTGRWSGRTFQPQNLPRPNLSQTDIDLGIAALKHDCADVLFPNVMELASAALRSCIVAPRLVVADLSNIEGRVLAWLAGEEWKLQAFRDFDAGDGEDLYLLAYAKAFNIPVAQVTKAQRHVGKILELSAGFGGGVGAFCTFATAFGIDLEQLANVAQVPQAVRDKSARLLAWVKEQKKPTFDLSDPAYIVCDGLKSLWREAHPYIVGFWRDVNLAVQAACNSPNEEFRVGHVTFDHVAGWLRIRLPSGRYLCYPDFKEFTFLGVAQFSRKWSRQRTYAGKLVENITQAVARDVLAHGAMLAEAAGYPIVLSVHDELLTESEQPLDGLCRCMASVPAWAPGLPLAAAGFVSPRYRK